MPEGVHELALGPKAVRSKDKVWDSVFQYVKGCATGGECGFSAPPVVNTAYPADTIEGRDEAAAAITKDSLGPDAVPISAFLWGSTPFLCARAKKWGGIGSRGKRLLPRKTAHTHKPPTSTSPLQKSGEERPDHRLVALTRMVEPPR